jgi:hypothetical protein
MYHLLYQSVNCAFCIYGSGMILGVNSDHFLKQRLPVIFVMVKCCVLFEVRTEYLDI